jgi:hypothetical protein
MLSVSSMTNILDSFIIIVFNIFGLAGTGNGVEQEMGSNRKWGRTGNGVE